MAKNKIPAPVAPAPVAPEAMAPELDPIEVPRPTKARVLVDVKVGEELYLSGSLLEADADVIESLGDQVDAHPDAVAYAEKLNG